MSEDMGMDLSTKSQLPFKSPVTGETKIEAPGIARLKDLTPSLGVLHLRGPDSEKMVVHMNDGQPRQKVLNTGEAHPTNAGILCRLTADEYLLLVESPELWEATFARLVDAAGGQRATVSDLTHGYGKLELSGSQATALLPRLCGLDFSKRSFPNGRVAQSSVAKVHATLVRVDERGNPPNYLLLVDRSVSVYVWQVMKAILQAFNPQDEIQSY
jgi:heterotetrameric sarcosine oxidase gamma subunit